MANITDTSSYGFLTNVANTNKTLSKRKIIKGMSYPLAKSRTKRVLGDVQDVQQVDYFARSTDEELVRGMMRQLFLTKRNERVMRPDFGLDLRKYVFEQLDITTYEIVKTEIYNTITKYAPFLEVISISIFKSHPSVAENGLIIRLVVKIRDINDLDPFEVELNV